MTVQIVLSSSLDFGPNKHFLPVDDPELLLALETMYGGDDTTDEANPNEAKTEEPANLAALEYPHFLLSSSSSAVFDAELENAAYSLFYGADADYEAKDSAAPSVTQAKALTRATDTIPLPQKRKGNNQASACEGRDAIATDSGSGPSKPKRRRKSNLEVPDVPTFMKTKLMASKGHGEFTIPELLILLFYSKSLFNKPNVYAKLKEIMQNKRSRASIRRKIEKIVVKEAGIPGGLLKVEARERTQQVLADQFSKLVEHSEMYGNASLKSFVAELKNYAANSTETMISSN